MPQNKQTKIKHNNSNAKSIRRQMKRERQLIENGKTLRVATHPPEITSIPWNQVTVRSQAAVATFNVFSVITLLRDQLHFTSNQGIDIRIHSIRAWAPLVSFSSGPLGPLRVRVHSLVPLLAPGSSVAQYPLLRDLIDYPDQTRRAAVGYEWPVAQQSVSLSVVSSTDGPSIIEITEGNTAGLLVYFRVWWRPTSGLSLEQLELTA